MLTQPTTTTIFQNYLGVCKANASSVEGETLLSTKTFFGQKSFFWGREHFFTLAPTLDFEFQKIFSMTLIPVCSRSQAKLMNAS